MVLEEGTSWSKWADTLTNEQIENFDYEAYVLFALSPVNGIDEWRKSGSIDGDFTSNVYRYWMEDSKGNIPKWDDSIKEGEVYTARISS